MSEKNIVIPEVIIGLGNPEKKYEKTRHNIGFEIVDYLADKWGFSWQKNTKFNALFCEGISPNRRKIRLVKPLTYMNLSGQSVRAVLDWYKLDAESSLVIYDDMDLPFGKIRLRLSGSAGGHNGMKSIISHVGTQKFSRFRIGIGKSEHKEVTVSHVLGKFSKTEAKVIEELMMLSHDAICLSLRDGVEKAMSLYNQKFVSIEDSLTIEKENN
ncbi:peptidyl-tRNA hydrolase [Geminocystis sp. NIES-3708]|uniref:aminoacyl-tRNA hydrolase n=1 Tax=Geminocystis sp. NIES-3708 TaxID=1615909 RepID=UPI0005FC52B1|nr:aminoacyl-tRNA hydrolase [Geminocystis sp. NIES-3708]BAQ60080.1 peptidyl-tRNA hydrolase [Geminocystis sp. NIES-3708]